MEKVCYSGSDPSWSTQGIEVKFNLNVKSLEKTATGIKATFTDDSVGEYDIVMFATGRKPRTEGLGLENVRSRTTSRA